MAVLGPKLPLEKEATPKAYAILLIGPPISNAIIPPKIADIKAAFAPDMPSSQLVSPVVIA